MSTFTLRASHTDQAAVVAGRRLGLVGLVLVLLFGGSAGAWAWWSASGAGTGTATTGTLNAPQNVTATSTIGSRDVDVQWTAPASGQTPTGYFVERLGSGGAAPACDSSPSSTVLDTLCTDEGVADGSYAYVVTAVFNSWTAVSAPSEEVTVLGAAATSTTLSSSANPSVVGQTVTYTATVSAGSGGGTPIGSVSFTDADVPITCSNSGGQTLNGSGVATCQVHYTAPAHHSVKAAFAGATGFLGSTSNALAQVVGKAATSTGLATSANPSRSGQEVTYTATVSVTSPGSATPTGSMDFKEGATTICANRPVSGGSATCAVTYPSVSSHSITATYSGDADLLGSSSATLNQSVNKAATSTSLTSGTNPAVTGQPITYTATVTVTGPGAGTTTGSVTFKEGTQTINCTGGTQTLNASGVATCISFSSAGARSISADYAGDGNFTSSTSNFVAQIVNKANTSTTLSASPSPSTTGQSVTLTATVSASSPGSGIPGGTVAFKDGATTIPSCSAQPVTLGVATCTMSFTTAIVRTLTADYSGNADYNASSGSTSHTVNTPVMTTTVLTSSANPVKTGQTVTYTATVSASSGSPSGTVMFKDGAATIACTGGNQTLTGSPTRTATCQASYPTTGTHSVTAVYDGQGVHSTSTSAAFGQRVVNSAVTGIVLTSLTVGNGGNAATTSCSGQGTANYACTITNANSNASVTAGVAFVDSSGAQTVYSVDPTAVGWTRTRPALTTGSELVAGGAAASATTVSTSKQGNQLATLTFSVDGFTATVTIS